MKFRQSGKTPEDGLIAHMLLGKLHTQETIDKLQDRQAQAEQRRRPLPEADTGGCGPSGLPAYPSDKGDRSHRERAA